MLLSELIFGPNEASWIGFWPIFRLRKWKLTKIRYFEQKIGKFCDFWLKWRSCGTEKCWKGGLVEQLREREMGSFLPHISVTFFKVSKGGGESWWLELKTTWNCFLCIKVIDFSFVLWGRQNLGIWFTIKFWVKIQEGRFKCNLDNLG